MAQEFLIRLWCDRHALTEERLEATQSITLSLPGYPERTVDLCDDCHVSLFADLTEVVAKNGRPAEAGEPQRRPAAKAAATVVQPTLEEGVPCPVCRYFANTSKALNNHWANTHREQLGNLADLFGNICPACAEGPLGNLGVHANRRHGVSGIAAVFQLAEREGDGHGIVRRFKERLAKTRTA